MIAAVNAWLRDHAHEHGATFIDYHAVLATETGGLRARYGTDGLHLSLAGYEAIEPLMLSALGRVRRRHPGRPYSTRARRPPLHRPSRRRRRYVLAVIAGWVLGAR